MSIEGKAVCLYFCGKQITHNHTVFAPGNVKLGIFFIHTAGRHTRRAVFHNENKYGEYLYFHHLEAFIIY